MSKNFPKDNVDDVATFLSMSDRFTSIKVSDVANVSQRNPWYAVDCQAPLRKLLDTVCRHNLHRVPIMDGAGDFYGIVSQSDLISFVADHFGTLFAPLTNCKIHTEQIGTFTKVFSITTKEPAIAAFELIHDLGVHGIAVVDAETGALVGNLSASDLRVIGSKDHSWSTLHLPCGEFVATARKDSHIKQILAVHRDATFYDVVKLFKAQRAHRIYVVDDKNIPFGVVSTIDLLKRVRQFLETSMHTHK